MFLYACEVTCHAYRDMYVSIDVCIFVHLSLQILNFGTQILAIFGKEVD